MSYETLHIYPQPCEHFPAQIIGTRAAIIDLRNALDKALVTGHGTEDFAQNDGEVYTVEIRSIAPAWAKVIPTVYEEYAGNAWSAEERAAFDAAMDGRAKA